MPKFGPVQCSHSRPATTPPTSQQLQFQESNEEKVRKKVPPIPGERTYSNCRACNICISKVLNMSKLRADITYNHRRQEKTPIVTVQTIISELESLKYNETLQDNTIDNTINNTIDNIDLTDNENFEVIDSSQESEEEIDEDTNSGDFGNYLQEWISMLEDEKEAFIDLEENENEELENIIHPAINSNAKWELLSLFKELNSPF
ncbi:hypothetical protein Glove_42g65 [Diversispora epigaea]|uniref:Uncharacterized protein n=2 Tax=Diversispora epigaea TaxID=1348612 RepID=A0A397JPS2_9GLOM|nr:hypothetical protein Glove_42g65 [Diversispora epigaea]